MKLLTAAILALSLPTLVLADELSRREPELEELSVEMPAKLIPVMNDSCRRLSEMTGNPHCYFATVEVRRDGIAVTYHCLSIEELLSARTLSDARNPPRRCGKVGVTFYYELDGVFRRYQLST